MSYRITRTRSGKKPGVYQIKGINLTKTLISLGSYYNYDTKAAFAKKAAPAKKAAKAKKK